MWLSSEVWGPPNAALTFVVLPPSFQRQGSSPSNAFRQSPIWTVTRARSATTSRIAQRRLDQALSRQVFTTLSRPACPNRRYEPPRLLCTAQFRRPAVLFHCTLPTGLSTIRLNT